jgi:glycosyltransferase involved in cell wall biosynthesis
MKSARANILISHPGRQHSHQAAMALHEAGMLAAYWAGVPSRAGQQKWIPEALRSRFIRYAPVDIPDELSRWLPVAVALRKLGQASQLRRIEQPLDFVACRAFDKQVAKHLEATGASAVIACEISALDTFRVAKRLGIKTILDAPSVHFATQDRVSPPTEPKWLHEKILKVKSAEIGLADHILTVSDLARTSYIETGVERERVHAVALGADTQLFMPCGGSQTERSDSQPFSFVFAGATIYRKGVDILLEAFSRVEQRLPNAADLLLIGARGDAAQLADRWDIGRVKVLPPVPQAELQKLFCRADCFVLPSRHDSFGMVVAEAMACGLPAIVSTMVGAKDMIDEGVNGWVLPFADVAALAERMIWCVENREAVAMMRPQARAAAERCSWEAYRVRLANLIEMLVGGRG